MGELSKLLELIFESDNKACFIERERILNRLEKEMKNYSGADKYAIVLSKLLAEVSTPILDCDYFAGRVVEALPDEGMCAPNELLYSVGHMSFDYEKVLRVGLKGILEEIKTNSVKKGDKASVSFAKNAEIVVNAIHDFSDRYAKEAENKIFPSYVLIKMIMSDESWHVVRNIRGVTGFVGPGSKPVPLTDEEVASIGIETVAKTLDYNVGDSVKIKSGTLVGFIGRVEEISEDKKKIKVMATIFGRETPVELDSDSVEILEV